MGKKRPINNILLFSTLMFSGLILTSCSTEGQTSTYETYWRESSLGDVETNDLERLQELVPFEIILPEYLPEELENYHPDLGYSKDVNVTGEIFIDVFFWTTQSPKRIIIEEFILPGLEDFLSTNDEFQYNILNFKDTKVLERVLEKTFHGQIAYIYRWIMNDVNYQMEIEGYSQDEARKVAESMI